MNDQIIKLEKNILKFLNNAVCGELHNENDIKYLKYLAYRQWKDGRLTDSEHCDIEAWLDSKFEGE